MSRAISRLRSRAVARRRQYPSDLVILGEDEGITEYDHDVQEATEEAVAGDSSEDFNAGWRDGKNGISNHASDHRDPDAYNRGYRAAVDSENTNEIYGAAAKKKKGFFGWLRGLFR